MPGACSRVLHVLTSVGARFTLSQLLIVSAQICRQVYKQYTIQYGKNNKKDFDWYETQSMNSGLWDKEILRYSLMVGVEL